ncbi:hypothetical protein RP20_CCG016523 [Aedes albopictus]|nr:hypothetical protein RP20_CCG016523 [Aedes albopictus]
MRFSTIVLLFFGLIITIHAKSILNIPIGGADESQDESSPMEDIQLFLGQLQPICYNRTGSNNTYKAIASHFYALPICVLMNLDLKDFVEDAERLNSVTRHYFFPKYCPQLRSTLQCIEPLLREMRKCGDDDDVFVLRAVSHALPEIIDLICDKNGDILFVENTDYNTCLNGMTDYFTQCNATFSNATYAMDSSNYGPEQCEELVNFRKCLENKMNLCNGPRLMDVFDVLYRAMVSASPCSNFIILPGQKEDNAGEDDGSPIRHF